MQKESSTNVTFAKEDEYISIGGFARTVGVSRQAIEKKIKQNRLPFVQIKNRKFLKFREARIVWYEDRDYSKVRFRKKKSIREDLELMVLRKVKANIKKYWLDEVTDKEMAIIEQKLQKMALKYISRESEILVMMIIDFLPDLFRDKSYSSISAFEDELDNQIFECMRRD